MVRCGIGLRTNMALPLFRGGAARAARKPRSASASAARRAICIVRGKTGTAIALVKSGRPTAVARRNAPRHAARDNDVPLRHRMEIRGARDVFFCRHFFRHLARNPR